MSGAFAPLIGLGSLGMMFKALGKPHKAS